MRDVREPSLFRAVALREDQTMIDVVYFWGADLEHHPDREDAMRELARLLDEAEGRACER